MIKGTSNVTNRDKVNRKDGGDTSMTREPSKEATKQNNLRRNVRIQSHPY